MSKWIDIKERMPERYRSVIVGYPSGYIGIQWWGGDSWGHLLALEPPAPTHWMPLPEPPTTEGVEDTEEDRQKDK